jgi:hypothetical protein
LGQLPVKPRDFFVPLLKGRLRPLECGALLLESALGLFPRQEFTLESGPSLSEGGSLLLKLSARLLARILLPLEPLLRQGKGGVLVRQAGPQQLGLLSLLLGLALPGPRPLEGGIVLLELSSGGSQLPLEFRRCNLHRPHPHAPSAAPRPAPGAPPAPSRLRIHLPQPGRPPPGARPARRAADTPATRCRFVGLRRERLELHTGPDTNCSRSSADQGDCTSLEHGPQAPVSDERDAGEGRIRQRTGAKAAWENLEFDNESTYLEDLSRRTSMDP